MNSNKFMRTHAQVESIEELNAMFHIQRSLGDVSPEIACLYFNYAGSLDIDLKNPVVLLTYYIHDFDIHLAVCNKYGCEDTVLAVAFNSIGQKIYFPKAETQGIFSLINLKKLAEVVYLDERSDLCDLRMTQLEKKLYTQHLQESLLEYKSQKLS